MNMRSGFGIIPPGQLRLLVLLCGFIDEHGCSPTMEELTRLNGSSSLNGTAQQLEAMWRKGLVEWEPIKARTLRPLVRVEVFLD